jgi:hypothetical protein
VVFEQRRRVRPDVGSPHPSRLNSPRGAPWLGSTAGQSRSQSRYLGVELRHSAGIGDLTAPYAGRA